jgi:uncharacterized protein (DUF2147 family)
MLRGRRGLVLALLLVLVSRAAPAAEAAPLGLWWAEGGAAQVEIFPCASALCGRVVWLRSPFDDDGCPVRDERNPDPTLRDRELIGMEFLSGLRPSQNAPNVWNDGQIYDPTSGRSYRATLSVEGPRRLRLRGYLGFELLGRTTRWIRVGGEDQCQSPD